jgi:hypothetical protein
MEIMNYAEMIENASLVKTLANKTIECSKDYTDSRKEDIVDQMMEYLALTVKDVLTSGIDKNPRFRDLAGRGEGLSFGNFGGDGTAARLQFYFYYDSQCLRVFFNEFGHWYSSKNISDIGLKYLIKNWEEYKRSWDRAITNGINAVNKDLECKLVRQLELHEVVKNFKI